MPAVTPVLLNLSFIGCTVLLAPRMAEPIWALAVAVILGGVLQLGTQYLALCRLGIRVRPRGLRDSLADGDVRRVLKLMVPALFGVGVAQLSILINTNIASHLGKGAVTWLNYADRLMEFPTALTSEALVSFLFQGRSFTPDDVSQTALAVVGYSVGLIGLIALKIVAPAFYARKDIRTPVKTAFWSLVVVQLVNLVSVPLFSHAGLALSVGVGSVFNAGTLLIILMRRGIYTPLPGWAKAVLRIALATLLMGAGLWYGQIFVSWTTMPWLMRAGGVLAMVAVAAVAYFAVMFACGWRLSDLRPGRGDD